MSASGNPPGSTLVSVIQQPSQGGMIQQQQGASQPSTQQILEASGSGTGQFQFTTLNQLPIDLHSTGGAPGGTVTTPGNAEESGVLLCNLDELSR